ncbi:kelch-like ECH-associated protein 1 [Amborella trichopoda]|uniref:Uncharacterized protein n=1 Tax=Amborella trichopoda TaxID=13333 RepID=W1P8U5_AMBTC|nr:kelch-like ECH-associated protein 1 [Amborella trichopoda]ERN03410.1 hypothetical protein AMTR_s00003p00259570 [Amborella trichopoda]|eukprot:XP_006841735.1 kelch-like ECH-associated protein 1 [Amborella trichopoda]
MATSSSPGSNSNTSGYRIYASFYNPNPGPYDEIGNWVEAYHPLDNSWHNVGPIPDLLEGHVLRDFAMVAVAPVVYFIGGRLCRKDDDVGEVDVAVRSAVYCHNAQTLEWSRCAPLGTPRFDFACTVSDGRIYVAGGQSSLKGARGVSTAEVYDPGLDVWTPLPSMSTLRYKCVGVTWQGRVHVVGGFTERGGDMSPLPSDTDRSSVEVFDPTRGVWELIANMWQLDVPPNQIVAVGSRLFSSGDCLNEWKGHIEAYDGNLNIWNMVDGSQLEYLSSPISSPLASEPIQQSERIYVTMAPIGTHLYFLAGYRLPDRDHGCMSVVHTFDTSASEDQWRSLEPVEEYACKELCSHCSAIQVS